MVRYVLDHESGDLSLLAACELGNEPFDMPSWVPNWSKLRTCANIWSARACPDTCSQARCTDGVVLNVCGYRAASIAQAVDILEDGHVMNGSRMTQVRIIWSVQHYDNGRKQYRNAP